MPKAFYTERDIDDLHARGVTSIDVHDDVVLTDLARERALKLGLRLNRVKAAVNPALNPPLNPILNPEDAAEAELVERIKAAVLARLGERWVDPAVLDAVVRRVVKEFGA